MDPQNAAIAAVVRQHLEPFKKEIVRIKQENELLREAAKRPRTVTEEIDAIPGRRIFYTLSGSQDFVATDEQRSGAAISLLVSQDGPFIMTHYPTFIWRPTEPSNATDLNRWRPITSWPLPDQVLDEAIIDISYVFQDSGPGRNFQNMPVPPTLISTQENLLPLPVPTLFTPNTTIQVTVTYHSILFNVVENGTAPTKGQLVVSLPGYRIVNL